MHDAWKKQGDLGEKGHRRHDNKNGPKKRHGAAKHDLHGKHLLYDGYYAHNLFYINILNDKGVDVSIKDFTRLDAGDVVFTHQHHLKEYIETHYTSDVIETTGNVITYNIHGKKEQPTD